VRFHLSPFAGLVAPIKNFFSGGAAASLDEYDKKTNYTELLIAHTLTPVAIIIEILGSWRPDATLLVSELGRQIAVVTGEPWSTSILRQRIDIAMQQGNVAAIFGTIQPVCDD